jgi:hypothetical protein
MVGTVSFASLICRVILGAGEGPAFSAAAYVYKWFPTRSDAADAILSQAASA